jgi:citronellol/citronellal dehydrogenase
MPFRSVFRQGLFAGQVHLVTGGGSGMGRCIAHELAALGARVAILGRKLDKLETVKAEIAESGGEAHAVIADIREEVQVKTAVADVLAWAGRIDGLVNNAGGQFPAALAEISQKGWDAVVRNNLTGGFLVSRECYAQWMRDNGGAIVNITADMFGGMPGMGHSGAARAGMANFTETAAVEWAASGIRVNSVAPGWIASSGFDTYGEAFKQHLLGLRRQVPLQRFGNESEVSAAVVFLLSPAAAFISGATVRVDGAAPNARRHWPLPAHNRSKPYDGFHLAQLPKLLRQD